MRPEAIAAVEQGMQRWANPSSPHAEGRAARAALEDARARIKAALGWDGELIFTSGASEAIAIAMTRARRGDTMVSAIEHDSVLRVADDSPRIRVRADGTVDLDQLDAMLDGSEAPLVAVQFVNSELGTFQPMAEIGARVAAAGGLVFCDCAQAAGKHPLPPADLIAISAHKFGGPPGVGALLVRDFAMLAPSGGQEFGYRGGTENLPGALGMAAALEATATSEAGIAQWLIDLLPALHALEDTIADAVGVHVAGLGPFLPSILTYSMPGVQSAAQLIQFDMAGIAVSAGSACSSGSLKTSHVLAAIGARPEIAESAIRVSFGWTTTIEDIQAFAEAWLRIAEQARSRAA